MHSSKDKRGNSGKDPRRPHQMGVDRLAFPGFRATVSAERASVLDRAWGPLLTKAAPWRSNRLRAVPARLRRLAAGRKGEKTTYPAPANAKAPPRPRLGRSIFFRPPPPLSPYAAGNEGGERSRPRAANDPGRDVLITPHSKALARGRAALEDRGVKPKRAFRYPGRHT
jgi:hypothetical protein